VALTTWLTALSYSRSIPSNNMKKTAEAAEKLWRCKAAAAKQHGIFEEACGSNGSVNDDGGNGVSEKKNVWRRHINGNVVSTCLMSAYVGGNCKTLLFKCNVLWRSSKIWRYW
jgi:hypothetical protein